MSIFTKYDQSAGKKKLKPWVKWTIGIALSGAAVVGVNHYTGDKVGLGSG